MIRRLILLLTGLVLVLACTESPRPPAMQPGVKRRSAISAPEPRIPTSDFAPVSAEDPTLGPATAPVTIAVYSDLQCPFCARAHVTLAQLHQRYGEQVRIVWKDLPLDFHKHARDAAMVAHVTFRARGNDAFWRLADHVFQHQSELHYESIRAWAYELGVDEAAIAQHGPQAEAKVARSLAEAQRLGILGTPNFLIDGERVTGAQKLETFAGIIDAHLRRASELAAAGVPEDAIYPAMVAQYWKQPAPVAEPEVEDTTVWDVRIGDAPTRGPKNALVTIVTFADFECPFCKRLGPTLVQLEKDYAGKLRFVWKNQPLTFHKRAMPAAIAAYEVRKQKGDEAFWKFHELLFASQPSLEDDDLARVATAIPGVDAKKVRAAVEKEKWRAEIERDIDQAESLDVSGTPTSFVNGRLVHGAQAIDKWKKVIDDELAKATAKVNAGTSADKLYEETIHGGKLRGPVQLAVPPDAPFRGGAKAKVVLQVFGDFECPFCRRLSRRVDGVAESATLEKVLSRYGQKIKIVWRDFPLGFHPRARIAAAFAREAKKQKGNDVFWKVHDDLFDLGGKLDDTQLEEIAKRYGIDWAKAKAAVAAGTHELAITEDMSAGGAVGITGTPAVVVNGKMIVGAQSEDVFVKAIDKALAAK